MTISESLYLHASRQYFVACKGLIHLYVTMTIHTAHAQKHFSPETKSKVRPKKSSPGPGAARRGPARASIRIPYPYHIHIPARARARRLFVHRATRVQEARIVGEVTKRENLLPMIVKF